MPIRLDCSGLGSQVNECINAYLQLKMLGAKIAERKEKGQEMPSSTEEIQAILDECSSEMGSQVHPDGNSEPQGETKILLFLMKGP